MAKGLAPARQPKLRWIIGPWTPLRRGHLVRVELLALLLFSPFVVGLPTCFFFDALRVWAIGPFLTFVLSNVVVMLATAGLLSWAIAVVKQSHRYVYGIIQILLAGFVVWKWGSGLNTPSHGRTGQSFEFAGIPQGVGEWVALFVLLRIAIAGWDDLMEWQKNVPKQPSPLAK